MVKPMANIILLGPPGSGKGTISAALASTYGYAHISTGNLFRQEVANQSALGQQVQNLLATGAYVPDSLTNALVAQALDRLNQHQQPFILDGYPRTVAQADFLAQLLATASFVVIELTIAAPALVARLSTRWFCPACKTTYNETTLRSRTHPNCAADGHLLAQRSDDQPAAIRQRLALYESTTAPLVAHYRQHYRCITIDASAAPAAVLSQVQKALGYD